MMKKLKPCPFCGGEAELCMGAKNVKVRCKKCFSRTAPYHRYEGGVLLAVQAWNRRNEMPSITASNGANTSQYSGNNSKDCNQPATKTFCGSEHQSIML